MPPRFTLRSSLTAVPTEFPAGRRFGDRIGDNALTVVTGLAGVGVVVLIGAIAWKVFDGSSLSFSEFGLGFLVHSVWDPVHNEFGALSFIYGTAVTSFIALLLAAPLAIGIALYLTELAPACGAGRRSARSSRCSPRSRASSSACGASSSSARSCVNHLEPWLQDRFSAGSRSSAASPRPDKGSCPPRSILTIMAVPIIASVAAGTVHQRSARPEGRGARARGDALGGRPRRRSDSTRAPASEPLSSSASAAPWARRSP